MPCYHPLRAYKTASGEVVFLERSKYDIVAQLSLPCGQCIGCRLERSRQWAMRCMHEASCHSRSSFATLTYDEKNLPVRGMLDYPAFQKFMKRLRKVAQVRFFMCGEYGPLDWRPHYHACIFGFDFPDRKYWSRMDSGSKLYRSDLLERLWPFGFSTVGDVTFESAAYVARYCVKKVNGQGADAHYKRVDKDGEYSLPPEFAHMSLKPGIGSAWFDKWKGDVYTHDYVIVNGVKCKPPKYYDRIFGDIDPDRLEEIKFKRETDGRARYEDNTEERLAVREICQRARCNLLYRGDL